jgi:hypothetical protein
MIPEIELAGRGPQAPPNGCPVDETVPSFRGLREGRAAQDLDFYGEELLERPGDISVCPDQPSRYVCSYVVGESA